MGVALGDSVAELSEITPGELTPVAPACKLSGTPAAGSPPIFTDIWHKAVTGIAIDAIGADVHNVHCPLLLLHAKSVKRPCVSHVPCHPIVRLTMSYPLFTSHRQSAELPELISLVLHREEPGNKNL